MTARSALLAVGLAAATWGCALRQPLRVADASGTAEPVRLAHVPFHPQQEHHCGPASLLTVLEASGVATDYPSVVQRVYVPGLEGSLQVEMLAAARGFGRIAYTVPPRPEAVFGEVAAGRPVLVLLNLGVPAAPRWHYAVVIGFDPRSNLVLLRSGNQRLSRQRAGRWMRRWQWAGRWGMVLLQPGEWPAAPDRSRWLRALAAFEDTGRPADAERAWQTATERWPDEPMAWLGLANMAHRRGDWSQAEEGYRRTLELDPALLPARLNLALTLLEAGRPCDGLAALGPPPPEDHPLRSQVGDLASELRGSCPAD